MGILIYNLLQLLVIALGLPGILPLVLVSEKRRKTVLPRLGIGHIPRGGRHGLPRPVWVHALSVGEVLSAVPLVRRLAGRMAGRPIFFSASTRTGFEMAKSRLDGLVHSVFYFPYDIAFIADAVIGKVNPGLFLVVETDLWPNLLRNLKRRGVPVVLVNARLSRKSFRGYWRFSFLFRPVFSSLSHVCAQTGEDAALFGLLGAPPERISVTGSTKADGLVPEGQREAVIGMSQKIPAGTKVMVAGSTHDGEEAVLRDAFQKLKGEFRDLVLVVVPRDPKRAGAVRSLFASAGFSTVTFTEWNRTGARIFAGVVVVDVIGVLRNLYAVADVAFVGGSLSRGMGGHNPLEPASFARPVLFGPGMEDFRETASRLLEGGGAVRVHDAQSLWRAAAFFLRDPKNADETGARSHEVFLQSRGGVDRTLKQVERYLL